VVIMLLLLWTMPIYKWLLKHVLLQLLEPVDKDVLL
jgi:hypothetical protein